MLPLFVRAVRQRRLWTLALFFLPLSPVMADVVTVNTGVNAVIPDAGVDLEITVNSDGSVEYGPFSQLWGRKFCWPGLGKRESGGIDCGARIIERSSAG